MAMFGVQRRIWLLQGRTEHRCSSR